MQNHISSFQNPSSSIVAENNLFYIDQSASVNEVVPIETFSSSITHSLIEQLWDNRAALKEITAKYSASHLDSAFRKKLFFQIDWLLNFEEWEAGERLADIDSYKTLIKFILNANLATTPYLGLSENGLLLASFISDKGKLTIECMPNEKVKYIAAYLSDGKQKRAAGDAESIKDLLDLLYPFKNAGWFLDGKN